jgi:hypothetical protein
MTELVFQKSDDMIPAVFHALQNAPDGAMLKFPTGEHHFWPERALKKYYCISNNRCGLKRVAFPITGKKNLTIDGNGSRFIFHGEIIPFVIEQCAGITLKNFSIDWQRPFYSQGVITTADETDVEIEIDRETYPYHFENDGTLLFDGEGWSHGFHEGIFEMDPRTDGPAYLSGDNLGGLNPRELNPQEISANRIRFHNCFPRIPRIGNVLLLRHYPRLCPGIHIRQSRDTRIEQVEINHCGGMGVIAQFSENITVSNCAVRPPPGTDRLFSVTVDATHFVNCCGLIRIKDSFFSNQMDDPANVHGINTRIKELLDDWTVITELVHREQHGVEIAFPGDTLSAARNDDLLDYAELTVKAVAPIDERYSKISFKEPLPAGLRPGDVLDNRSRVADVHISGCTSHNNRARGYLLSTPGKIILENNFISAAGSGVKISGDANYWFESGPVRDVLIRNNTFTDCCYGPPSWGRAVIDIDPEIENPWNNRACYHRNIRIENNTFRTFDTGILYARSVDGLRFAGNTVKQTDTYPIIGRMDANITLDACRNSDIQDIELSTEINDSFHTRHEVEKQPSLAL